MNKGNEKVIVENEDECCQFDGRLNLPSSIKQNLERIGGLDSLLEDLPTIDQLEPRSRQYQTLSDPARLRILYALVKCDLCPCILKEVVGQSDSKLSYHLDILEEAGLIRSTPQKKWRIISITELGRSQIS
jgi:ArsR family transcriptional regulator